MWRVAQLAEPHLRIVLTAGPPVLLAHPRAHRLYEEKLVLRRGLLCFHQIVAAQAQMRRVFADQNDNDALGVAALPQKLFLQKLAPLTLLVQLPSDLYLRQKTELALRSPLPDSVVFVPLLQALHDAASFHGVANDCVMPVVTTAIQGAP